MFTSFWLFTNGNHWYTRNISIFFVLYISTSRSNIFLDLYVFHVFRVYRKVFSSIPSRTWKWKFFLTSSAQGSNIKFALEFISFFIYFKSSFISLEIIVCILLIPLNSSWKWAFKEHEIIYNCLEFTSFMNCIYSIW